MRRTKISRAKTESNYRKKMRKKGYTIEYFRPMRAPFKRTRTEPNFINHSEPGTGQNRVGSSQVKWLTGSETYNTSSCPIEKHTFIIANYTPHAPADDFNFFEAMFQIPRRKRRNIIFNRALIPT